MDFLIRFKLSYKIKMELESPLKYKVLLNEFHDEKYSANDELTKDQFCQFLDRKVSLSLLKKFKNSFVF